MGLTPLRRRSRLQSAWRDDSARARRRPARLVRPVRPVPAALARRFGATGLEAQPFRGRIVDARRGARRRSCRRFVRRRDGHVRPVPGVRERVPVGRPVRASHGGHPHRAGEHPAPAGVVAAPGRRRFAHHRLVLAGATAAALRSAPPPRAAAGGAPHRPPAAAPTAASHRPRRLAGARLHHGRLPAPDPPGRHRRARRDGRGRRVCPSTSAEEGAAARSLRTRG